MTIFDKKIHAFQLVENELDNFEKGKMNECICITISKGMWYMIQILNYVYIIDGIVFL